MKYTHCNGCEHNTCDPDFDHCNMIVNHWDTHVKDFVNPDPEKYDVVYITGFSEGINAAWYKEAELGTHWLVEKNETGSSYTIIAPQTNNKPYRLSYSFKEYHCKLSPFYRKPIKNHFNEELFAI